MDKRREIYIKLEYVKEIVEVMKEIKQKEESLKQRFYEYDKINSEENRLFENWNNNLDEIMKRLDHVTL